MEKKIITNIAKKTIIKYIFDTHNAEITKSALYTP